MKKLILFFITACMLVTCFACNDKNDKKDKDPIHLIVPITPFEGLPRYDFNGRSFRISSRDEYGALEVMCADEESEELLDMALLYRNAKVENKSNIVIELQNNEGAGLAHINKVLEACLAKRDAFDLAMTYAYESSPLITSDSVFNWARLPYNDLTKSYWLSGMNIAFSVYDTVYVAVSKMCLSTLGQTAAMVYNRDLAVSWKGEEFIKSFANEIVYGEWTYDRLMELVNEFGINNDGACGLYLTADNMIDSWHAAWDIPCIENSLQNGLGNVMMNDKYLSYADRMQTMYYGTSGILHGTREEALDAFMNGKALFTTVKLSETLDVLPAMGGKYTIIPQPKYDENQDDYRSAMLGDFSVMSIPNTADQGFASLIAEAMSIASEEHVYPAYRYDYLYGTGLSTAESIGGIWQRFSPPRLI